MARRLKHVPSSMRMDAIRSELDGSNRKRTGQWTGRRRDEEIDAQRHCAIREALLLLGPGRPRNPDGEERR